IEQEMRIHLGLERRESGARQLFTQSCKLDVAVPRLFEIPNGVCHAGNGEIQADTKRERGKNPVERVENHSVDHVVVWTGKQNASLFGIERCVERDLKRLSRERPCEAEQRGERKVQTNAPTRQWARDRPTP